MNTTAWKKIETVLLVLLLITTAGLGIYLVTAVDQIRSRLGRLEDEVLDLAHPDGATRSAATRMKKMSADMADLTDRLKALDDRIGAILLKARANSKRLDSLEAGDLSDLGLGALIDRKLKGGAQGAGPLGSFAGRDIDSIGDKIQLTDLQRRRVANLMDRAKEDVMDVLTAARQEDPELVEYIGNVMRSGEDIKNVANQLLPKLFNNNVPGTDESYFSALLDIRQNATADFGNILSADQLDAFGKLEIDIFGIGTGYSPFKKEGEKLATENQ